jgi:hypothetical protein
MNRLSGTFSLFDRCTPGRRRAFYYRSISGIAIDGLAAALFVLLNHRLAEEDHCAKRSAMISHLSCKLLHAR